MQSDDAGAESAKPSVPSTSTGGSSKLDSLSKDDLVKFAKKQVVNLGEMKKTQQALAEKLKSKMSELEATKNEVANLKIVNEKLADEAAQRAENKPTECTECLKKCDRLMEIETEMTELRDKATRADMFSLEIRDLESKIDNLTRSLREKSESLVKAHEVIAENDSKIVQLSADSTSTKSHHDELRDKANKLTKELEEEKLQSTDYAARLRSAEARLNEMNEKQGSEKMGLARKMAESENRGRLLEEAIEALREENDNLKSVSEEAEAKVKQVQEEFAAFKNRAHFVLEQKGKQDDESRELSAQLSSAKDEVINLRVEVDELRQKQLESVSELSTSRSRSERLDKELELSQRKCIEAETSHLSSMDELRVTSSKALQRADEEIRLTRAARDTAEQKFKELQIVKEKTEHVLTTERHRSEVENGNLKAKLEDSIKLVKKLELELQESMTATSKSTSATIPMAPAPQKAVAAVVPLSASGSSIVPADVMTSSMPHQHQYSQHRNAMMGVHRPLVPLTSDSISCYEEPTQPERSLEDVLYGDLEDGYNISTSEPELTEEKFALLLEELENMKKTNEHVSELLNEAETANGRLLAQNSLLKEEIRRLEREKGREQELADEKNMEYLKNVLVQFLKPESVQMEREQLIVVLQRVLHLSPVETNILKASAEQMALAQASNATWGTYFSGWGGSS